MSIKSRYINGALAFYDSASRARIVDAIGTDVVKVIDDFTNFPVDDTTGDPTEWTVTVVEAGGGGDSTVASFNYAGGAIRLTTDNAEDDGYSMQLNGESFGFVSGQPVYFGVRVVGINDVTQSDTLLGLCITDTALLGGMTDGVYFRSVDGSTAISGVTEKDSSETAAASTGTLVDATATILEFFYDGTRVEFWQDGTSLGTSATNIPDDEELRLSFEFLTGETQAQTLDIDWVRVIQFGRSQPS